MKVYLVLEVLNNSILQIIEIYDNKEKAEALLRKEEGYRHELVIEEFEVQ